MCHGHTIVSRIINRFGNACLVQTPNRQFKLVRGSRADLAAAREWASFFAHHVVFSQFESGSNP
jgi:hypothetical protein